MNKYPNIRLHVEPATSPITKHYFIANYPRFSTSLDGYTAEETFIDLNGPHANFNHHDKVDRESTRATCEQILWAIRQNFYGTFCDSDGKRAEIYANDCDQDVCTSVFLLMNPDLATDRSSFLLNRLVTVEGLLDASTGSYPIGLDLSIMREIAWIFRPYTEFVNSGRIKNKDDAAGFEEVISACFERIHKYLVGQGSEIELDTRLEVIELRNGYVVVEEVGEHAILQMFNSGIDTFMSIRSITPGAYSYVIGKRSQFIPVDIELICRRLNKLDTNISHAERWGGGNLIIGSPRVTGSSLSPSEVCTVIDDTIQKKVK
jgi:hypothetical protein